MGALRTAPTCPAGLPAPARRRSEGDGPAAHGTGGATLGSEHEVVGAGLVGQSAVHREGAAGGVRGSGAPRGDAAVVLDRPVPDLAGAVAVDLGLELDPAVVGLRLELSARGAPRAPVGA